MKTYEFNITPTHERYYNEDSNWGVYTFDTRDNIPHTSNNYLDLFSGVLAGKIQRLTIGLEYKVTANPEFNKKYESYSYIPQSVILVQPKTSEQQANFLHTLVTNKQAEAILAVYPNIIDDVVNGKEINTKPIKGIGDVTWQKIKNKIEENYVISDILALLSPLGITIKTIKTLLSFEQNPVLLKKKIIENPYILTKAKGIGFKKADEIAIKLNPDLKISKYRVEAFVHWFLYYTANTDGDTWVTKRKLDTSVDENIPECYDIYEKFLEEQKSSGEALVIRENKIGLKYFHNLELSVLSLLDDLNYANIKSENIEDGIEEAEKSQQFSFTDEQKNAIKRCCESNVSLITGQAGTGKSTILRSLVNIYQGKRIECCALSAKAAQRIIEVTGHEAKTIHRLLEYKGDEFAHNKENPLPCDVLILDEASMVNASIFHSLLCALRKGTKVIICGDDEQLPPIGCGNIFHDLLESERYTCCKLTQIHRQAEKSGIIIDSRKVRQNKFPVAVSDKDTITGELHDMIYKFRSDREKMRDYAIKTYLRSVKENGTDSTIIITPCKQNRTNSTAEFNQIIQSALILDSAEKVEYGKKVFRVGAKVIQRTNDYEKGVFNGEMGYIINVYEDKSVLIDFGNGKKLLFNHGDLANLELAYALTVHVTQGSGYDNVIILIDNTHYKLLDSCLLYTAITRARKKCLLIAEPSAFDKCIRNKASERKTWLSLENKKIRNF